MSKLLNAIREKANRTTIQTTKGPIIVREFLLRELKQIVELQGMKDQTTSMIKMLEIINSCIETEGVKMENLPSVDTELVYLALHRLTKGDTVQMALHCGHCVKEFDTSINLGLVQVEGEHQATIKLDGGLILNMRSPTMTESLIASEAEDQIFNLAMRCIVSVDTGAETMVVGEHLTHEDLKELIDYLNESGFVALFDFINNIPTIKLRHPVKCPHCQVQDVLTLNGLADIIAG